MPLPLASSLQEMQRMGNMLNDTRMIQSSQIPNTVKSTVGHGLYSLIHCMEGRIRSGGTVAKVQET